MGRNKAFLALGERPLIEIVIERLEQVCAEVLIVANDANGAAAYTGLGLAVVTDRFPGVGVLGGLHAGLTAASHDLTLAVGCDMPFLQPDLLQAFAGWAVGFDAVVLRHSAPDPQTGRKEARIFVEPLHAAYRRSCLPALETAIQAGKRRIISFFPDGHVRYVTLGDIAPFDPNLRSFRNVNTPEEWRAARAQWKAKSR